MPHQRQIAWTEDDLSFETQEEMIDIIMNLQHSLHHTSTLNSGNKVAYKRLVRENTIMKSEKMDLQEENMWYASHTTILEEKIDKIEKENKNLDDYIGRLQEDINTQSQVVKRLENLLKGLSYMPTSPHITTLQDEIQRLRDENRGLRKLIYNY